MCIGDNVNSAHGGATLALHARPSLKTNGVHTRLPTKTNVQKMVHHMGAAAEGVVYLRGNLLYMRDDTDVELPFRQESHFFYLTGVNEPGFHFLYDFNTSRSFLFVPAVDTDSIVWIGQPDNPDELLAKYDVDEVHYESLLPSVLKSLRPTTIHALDITDTSVLLPAISSLTPSPQVEISFLRPALAESRLTKQDWEIDLLRRINRISSDAHERLMREVRPGQNEYEMHALFVYECARRGAFFQCYAPIVASGKAAATLHYNRNNRWLEAENPYQMLLVDAGAELMCYGSDITRTYPTGGKFSAEARVIYNIVEEMQDACYAIIKPGVEWERVHRTAELVGLRGLVKAGILVGNEEELLKSHVTAAFFPHGLGHLLGLDVHDVGGYPAGVERIQEPGIRYLRMRRPLQKGMVVTVEPGIYFCDFMIDPVLSDPDTARFINREVLARYRSVGGVRIEDDVLITEDGFENLTTVPRSIEEIERIMAQGKE
ncbi:peptidase M24, structural domain-containing protein [Jimgerdemannia flammicorona]|uniref:Peptidase M24, structural domain-containing protein n=2 Tax=Jimgerdemannia flammicorona TaxID=994334 RepID=A0A433QZ59_9FUNG|nr:peptidase M24, structural domain-containing protein [Jimgerdemannia flammicorona]RUS35063.1 peptidase M24, structural domain-containing protein [Jimgerdemannia flammicorona]